MNAANRVALNTGILYGRMFITMGITLYSTRLILNALGSTDFGIFNLIAGVILMLSFLNSAMSTSTQRYLSYHQGKDDIKMQQKVFSNSLILHIFIGLIIIVLLEIAGLFLFDGFLNIPANRITQAKLVYHFMSFTVFFTIITVPFNGSLVARENMLWVAFVNIVETGLKLGIAFLLYIVSVDKLVVYGCLTAIITVISFILYAVYCLGRYEECSLRNLLEIDKDLIKELSSFAGWNLFGALCYVGRTQGIAIMLNLFFGSRVNAAYGIANQVGSQLLFFSSTLLRALNPQIMKSEGAGDRQRMLRISMMASKFGFFLLAFIAIPCIFEMPEILRFWLKNVPEHTVIFCQLILVGTLINQLTVGLQSAAQAMGNVRKYQAIVGGLTLFNLPMAYYLLNIGMPAFTVLITFCGIELVTCFVRIYLIHELTGMSIYQYITEVFVKEAIPVFAIIVSSYLLVHALFIEYRFMITISISSIMFFITIYFFGLKTNERNMIKNLIANKLIGKVGKI